VHPLQQMPDSTQTIFVTRTSAGMWRVTDNRQSLGGIFGTASAAMKFAREEAEWRRCDVVTSPPPREQTKPADRTQIIIRPAVSQWAK
jgi:hypothetical protein